MGGRCSVVHVTPKLPCADFITVTKELSAVFTHIIESKASSVNTFKFHLRVSLRFTKSSDETIAIDHSIVSHAELILHSTDVHNDVNESFSQIQKNIDSFVSSGSGWVLTSINSIDAYILEFTQFLATAHIKLPQSISLSHAILNIRNFDSRCFIYSVLAAIHPIKHGEHANRVSRYKPYEKELDTSGISFPVSLSDVKIFEQKNNLAINVFGYSSKLYPLQLSSSSGRIINLLFLSNKSGNSHYALIKDLDKLLYKENKHHGKKYFCNHCLMRFQIQDRRDAHQKNCQTSNQEIEMPDDTTMVFQNHKHGLPQPLCLYADFECFPIPMPHCNLPNTSSFTTKVQKHVPNSYALLPVFKCCSDTASIPLQQYRGGDAVCHFLRTVLEHAEQYQCEYNHKQGMLMNFEDREEFRKATTCFICDKAFATHYDQCNCG